MSLLCQVSCILVGEHLLLLCGSLQEVSTLDVLEVLV